MGTTTRASTPLPEFPGIWHLYIATTFDFGQTWTVQNVTPNDPIQRGGICGDGTCRNLLDFMDIQIDKQGRVLVAGEDGCIGGCVNGGAEFLHREGVHLPSIGREADVLDLRYANRRSRPVPGAPQVSAVDQRHEHDIALSWPEPDNGGSPIVAL